MVIVIDNYDSFVYNLARYVSELGYARAVFRNDAISIQTIEQLRPSHLILSPGPCTPDTAGICLTLVQHFTNHIPILGVCLGHQIIGQAFGSRIGQAQHPMHGMSCDITHTQQGIFQNLPNPLTV
nr:anthranilate/aminodeoxychorismate synthase component II [Legionellales bacterium]